MASPLPPNTGHCYFQSLLEQRFGNASDGADAPESITAPAQLTPADVAAMDPYDLRAIGAIGFLNRSGSHGPP